MHNGMQAGHTLWSRVPGVIMLFRLSLYFFCGSWEAFLDQRLDGKSASNEIPRFILQRPWTGPDLILMCRIMLVGFEEFQVGYATCDGRLRVGAVCSARTPRGWIALTLTFDSISPRRHIVYM